MFAINHEKTLKLFVKNISIELGDFSSAVFFGLLHVSFSCSLLFYFLVLVFKYFTELCIQWVSEYWTCLVFKLLKCLDSDFGRLLFKIALKHQEIGHFKDSISSFCLESIIRTKVHFQMPKH